MKKIAIFIVVFLPILVVGQTNSIEDQISKLETICNEQAAKNKALVGKINNLENKIESLKSKLDVCNDSISNQAILLQQKTNNILELQAQSEEAVNLSLEGFEKKYNEQNNSIAYLKEKMKEDLATKLIFYGIIILIFTMALYFGVKIATKNLLKKQKQGWVEFNESLFKK